MNKLALQDKSGIEYEYLHYSVICTKYQMMYGVSEHSGIEAMVKEITYLTFFEQNDLQNDLCFTKANLHLCI